MEKLERVRPNLAAAGADRSARDGADDAGGHGVGQAEGVADGDHQLADLHLGRVGHGDRVKLGGGDADLDHGQIAVGIRADQLGIGGFAVREGDGDDRSALDHVVIGDDMAVRIPDKAGAFSGGDSCPWPP